MTDGVNRSLGLEGLTARHEELARTLIEPLGQREAAGAAANEVRAFVDEIMSAGAELSVRRERKAAQSMLDFWSSTLVGSPAARPEDCVPPVLAPSIAAAARTQGDGRAGEPPSATIAAAPSSQPTSDEDRSRIRIAAVARQYRDAGNVGGYLLWGAALEEAAKFTDDPDIDRLVGDSRRAVFRNRIKSAVIGALSLVSVVLAGFGWYKLYEDRDQAAERRRMEIRQAEELREKDDAAAEAQLRAAERYQKQLSELAAKQLAEAEKAKRMTDALAQFIAARKDTLDVSALSEEARAEVLAAAERAAQATKPSAPDYSLFNGYQKNFLGFELPPPAPPAGAPTLAYVNYSIVMDPKRRMALYSASNLDRLQRKSLLRSKLRFTLDPRLDPMQQPDPAWFGAGGFEQGRLVTRAEIAWGGYFDTGDAGPKSEAVTSVYPNVTPRFATFSWPLWAGLDRWALSEFNEGAGRVTIFTGPIFEDDDPDFSGAKIPRRYWKVVVSVDPASSGKAVSDAFVLAQTKAGGTEKIDPTDFDANRYRVPITEVERLAGLDFGPVVRASQSPLFSLSHLAAPSGAAPGVAPFDPVAVLDGPDRKARLAAVDNLVQQLRNSPEAVQLQSASALVAVLQIDRASALTPTGRINLLFALSNISQASWRKASWASVRASARRGVADIEKAAAAGSLTVGPDTQKLLDALKGRIDYATGAQYAVDFQFAGMTRSAAVATSQGLKDLGWRVSGEERTANAASQNEVRYSDPADEPAAQLLAADLRALGWTKVTPQPLKSVKIATGRLEVWISE